MSSLPTALGWVLPPETTLTAPSHSECQHGELQRTSRGCQGNSGPGEPTVPVCPGWRGGFPGLGTFISRTRTVPDKPGWLVTLPWPPTPPSASPVSGPSWSQAKPLPPYLLWSLGLGEGPGKDAHVPPFLGLLPLSRWSEWSPCGPCLQDCPRGALARGPSWPLLHLGPHAGFRAAPPPPLFGPRDGEAMGRGSRPLHCATQPAVSLPRPWSLPR